MGSTNRLLRLVSFVIGTVTISQANASPIYQETLQGNGETNLIIERTLNVSESGRYFLTLKNGDLGPRNIEQCENEDTVALKRECLFENLNERIEQNFTRMRNALIHINGVRVRHSLAPNERTITQARGLLKIPVTLQQGVNTLKVDYLGYSTARLHLDLEKAPETLSAPFARFLLNRITGNTSQEFRLNARESFSPEAGALTYAWSWGDEPQGFVPTPSTETLVTHTYQAAGTYHAKLLVTDTVNGLFSEFGIDLVVTAVNPNVPPENEAPKPVIQWAIDNNNPMRVTFNGSQSTDDGEIVSYAWRFTNQAGQHTNLTGETLTYTFFQPGSYTIRLSVTDNLGKTANQTRVISLAPLNDLVQDEILLSARDLFGTFETEIVYTETLNIPEPKLAKIRIKNADGLDHPIQDCSLIAMPAKLGCLYDNLVNRTYVQLYRVNTANVFVNGRKITDGTSLRKQTKDFETVVSLAANNTIEIRVRGWPTAFINVEIQALETNLPPIAVATHGEVKRGAPQTIEFQALQSTDPNDQVVSYRFQAKLEGASSFTIDTDWQASGIANLTFPTIGRWQVVTSARDKFGAVGTAENLIEILPNNLPTLQITYGIYTNQSPYRVQVRATSSDADGDFLLYNFAFSNGQTTGFQSLSTAVAMFSVSGNQSVTVTVRDQNGGETVGTANFTLSGNLVPVASFAFASPRAGYAPHTVSFDASASSDPDGSVEDLLYLWNFGDGTTGTGKLVDHTFQLGGEYIVALTVVDPQNGAGSQSRAIFSWTNEPPVPLYTVTAVPGTLQRIFNASGSTPGDSPIQAYNFETGDGNFVVQTTPVYTHTYLSGGVYNTSLRVYDAEGDANITGQTITVFNGQKPAANINLVSADVVTPAIFVLNAAGSATPNSGATLNGWRWTLPGGETRLGPNLVYETNQHGNFSITLQVRDSFGFWSDSVTQEFSATSGVLPIARIETNRTTALVGEPIHFSGLTSSTLNANANLVSYEWTTPSGAKLYGPEVDIGLSQPGLKTITLVVTDSKGYVSEPASFQVNIVQPTKPVAVFTLSDAGNIIPVWRHADAHASYAVSPGALITGYEWRIQAPEGLPNGIDFSLFGPEVDLLFDQTVTYTVSLRVFDSAGGTSDWVSQTFGPLQNSKPIANLLPGSMTATAPATITFSSFGSFDPDGHSIIGYYWNLGDGSERYEPGFQHQYTLPGVYTVEFAVQDSFGLWSDPVFATITVVENQPPVPVITMQDDPGGNRFKKIFSAALSSDPDGSIVEYHWFLSGEPRSATGPELEYTFPGPGHYTMGLDVVDNHGALAIAWYSLEIQANQAPIIRAKYEVENNNPMRFLLDGSASTDDTAITSFVWRNGGNVIGTSAALNHTFSSEGIKAVSLEVTDSEGASSSKSFSIHAFENSAASFMLHEPSDNVVDPETSIDYIANEPIPMSGYPRVLILQPRLRQTSAEGLSYSWRINDVEISNSDTPQIAFTNPGQNKLSLVVQDGANILAKVSRAIEPDNMSCGGSFSETGILCLTIPGVHSYIGAPNGTEFEFPLGESLSGYNIEKVSVIDLNDMRPVTLTSTVESASISNNKLLISKSEFDLDMKSRGPAKLQLTLVNSEGDRIDAEIPYFIFAASKVQTLALSPGEELLIRDPASGMIIHRVGPQDNTTFDVPSTNLEFELASSARNPASGFAYAKPGTELILSYRHEADSEFGTLISSMNYNPSANGQSTSSTGGFSAMSNSSMMSLSNTLSKDSGVVAFLAVGVTNTPISPDYLTSTGTLNTDKVSYTSGVLKGAHLIWNSDEIGDSPSTSTTPVTKTLECTAYEDSWNKTPEVQGLESLYSGYVSAWRALVAHDRGITPLRNEMGVSAINLKLSGVTVCALYNDISTFNDYTYWCLGEWALVEDYPFTPAQRAELYKIRSIYPTYKYNVEMRNLDSPSLSSSFQTYLNFGASLGFESGDLQAAIWRRLLLQNPTSYNVIAKYRLPNRSTVYKIDESFSSSGLKGDYTPDLHRTLYQPANALEIPGLKTTKVPFTFPAGAYGIEFEIKPASYYRDSLYVEVPNYQPDLQSPHVSRGDKFGSATCRVSENGYRITKVEIDPAGFSPNPNVEEREWIKQSFKNWPNEFNVIDTILNGGTNSRKNQRFTTYVANSVLKNEGYLAIDFDRLATDKPNPLTAPTVSTNDESSLTIPVTITVAHEQLPAPSLIKALGKIGNSSNQLLSKSDRENDSSDYSVYKFNLNYNSLRQQMAGQVLADTSNPANLDYQFLLEAHDSSGPTATRAVLLTPMLNARYNTFEQELGGGTRSIYGGAEATVSAFVNPTMAKIITALDYAGNNEGDFLINDGSLSFGKAIPSHKGHNTGEMLDIRTFGVKNSAYERFNKSFATDTQTTNDDQLFDTSWETKFKNLAVLMLASYKVSTFYSTSPPSFVKLKTALECAVMRANDPETCDPATEITVERCLFLEAPDALGNTSCQVIRTELASLTDLKQAHAKYRNYILRNREAWASFRFDIQRRQLPMPSVIYSSGAEPRARRSLLKQIGSNNVTENYTKIDSYWNVRMLKEGTIPMIQRTGITSIVLSGVKDDGVPLQKDNQVPNFNYDSSATHLDHYHITINSKESQFSNDQGAP